MRLVVVVGLGLGLVACGSVPTGNNGDVDAAIDGNAAALDGPGTPDAAPALPDAAVRAVAIDGPSAVSAQICTANGVFSFTVSNGTPNATVAWNGTVGLPALAAAASLQVPSDASIVPASGELALNGAGAGTVDFSYCSQASGTREITINVGAGADVTTALKDVGIGFSPI